MNEYPDNVINKILQITLEMQSFAYLAVNDQYILINQGGKLADLNLPEWDLQSDISNDILFLSGFFPMSNSYEMIPLLHITDEIIVDTHLFHDNGLNWIIFVDKSSELEWQKKARQNANELSLLQQHTSKKVTNFEFFEALNMMALLMNEDGVFELIRPVSDSFMSICPEVFQPQAIIRPQERFPFIENFLIDAKIVWDSKINHNRISSGPWVEITDSTGEVALNAIAMYWEGHKLLFIELLESTYRQNHDFLQRGRENVLTQNILEKEVLERTKEIRETEEELALRLAFATDARDDGETGAHIRRLGLYSALIAKHLSWDQKEIDEIRLAAPMHDIGKIGIPDYILRKPGKLTEEEFKIMKTHAKKGGKILSNSASSLVRMAGDIALQHHEWWDGSGYPDGLSGENIALSARIVCIVDVFDALISERVYKKAFTVDTAIKLMLEGRGTQFDPTLFDLFIELKEELHTIYLNYRDIVP